MLLTEWNAEEAKVVWREEGMEIGMGIGMEKGMGIGMEKGMGIGREEGIGIGREEVARNALAKGIPLELIHDITGLDEEALKHIQVRL